MKFPFIKYIETLVIGKMSLAGIQAKMDELSLKFPDKGLSIVRERFAKEQASYFENKEELDLLWLADWGVESMYGYIFNVQVPSDTDGIKGAHAIMNDPLMYRLITSMALSGITEEDIELIVNGKYNIQYSSQDINEFLYYFFNVEGWTLQEKQEYVDKLKDSALKKFYKLAMKGDKDYLLWKLGAAPDKSFNSMLRDMMVDSYYNFKERSKVDPDTAQKWGALAVKLTDRLDRLEKDTGDKRDLFDAIQFQIDTVVLKSSDEKEQKTKKNLNQNSNKIKHITEVNNDQTSYESN